MKLKLWNILYNPVTNLMTGIILLSLIGIIDFLQGYRLSFSIFYLLPISMITWFNGKSFGIIFSVASAIVWFVADYYARPGEPDIFMLLWNSSLRLGFFLIVTWLLVALNRAYDREKNLARKDFLTQAWNRFAFYELAEMELARTIRYGHVLSLTFLDIDNFKQINDRYGHETGDRLLYRVTQTILQQIRKTDVLSRLGGDEFGLLLPETTHHTSRILLERINKEMLRQMTAHQWPVTFSIGSVTFKTPPSSVAEMIQEADRLMYTVKKSGKNRMITIEKDKELTPGIAKVTA